MVEELLAKWENPPLAALRPSQFQKFWQWKEKDSIAVSGPEVVCRLQVSQHLLLLGWAPHWSLGLAQAIGHH